MGEVGKCQRKDPDVGTRVEAGEAATGQQPKCAEWVLSVRSAPWGMSR